MSYVIIWGVLGFQCLLICLFVDFLQVLDVHPELPCDLLAALFPGVIAPYPITPAIWLYVKWPIVGLQGVLIGCIEVLSVKQQHVWPFGTL